MLLARTGEKACSQEVTPRENDRGGSFCPSVSDSATKGSCGGCTGQRVYKTVPRVG